MLTGLNLNFRIIIIIILGIRHDAVLLLSLLGVYMHNIIQAT